MRWIAEKIGQIKRLKDSQEKLKDSFDGNPILGWWMSTSFNATYIKDILKNPPDESVPMSDEEILTSLRALLILDFMYVDNRKIKDVTKISNDLTAMGMLPEVRAFVLLIIFMFFVSLGITYVASQYIAFLSELYLFMGAVLPVFLYMRLWIYLGKRVRILAIVAGLIAGFIMVFGGPLFDPMFEFLPEHRSSPLDWITNAGFLTLIFGIPCIISYILNVAAGVSDVRRLRWGQ